MYENHVPAQSPVFGLRVVNRDCLTPQGFSPKRLDAVYAELASSAHGFDMLMESASFGEVDSYYNPGEEEVSPDFILEAIVVDKFSQTERRMSAVVRVLNRFLSGSEIKALLPVVGKPRKTGAYAYVTVQLPFSDGQTVSVVFHSPEGDKKKIAPNDTIIAFQWLLNRRDITHVVAPENGAEISLDELAKKITQLVVKNSARFERMQKDAAEERKTLDDTRKAVDDAEGRQRELMTAISDASGENETTDAKLSNTLALLEKQKTINAELQAKLDALEKARANGGGDKSKPEEEHYSYKVLSALVESFGWTRSGKEFVQKDVGGGTTGGMLNPTGKRIVSAGFDRERHRYITLMVGFNDILDVDGRLALSGEREDVLAVARDFDTRVMEWASKTAEKKPGITKQSILLELPITAFRPEELRVAFEDGRYLVQTRRNGGEWITQKAHITEAEAIQDAQDWYPDTGGGDSELKRPDRQEEPFAAFLDGYNNKTKNPYILTSDMSDAFVLGRYFVQQGHERPKMVTKSRGNSWRVVMNCSESTDAVEAVFDVNGETVKQKSGPAPRRDAETYSVGSLEKKIASLLSEVAVKGIAVPSPTEFMTDVEAERRVGKRKTSIAQDLKEHKKDLSGLKSGTVTARKIIGAGGKKEMAEAWLLLQIDACYTALEDGTGFRCTANMGNYVRMLNDALEGKDISALIDSKHNPEATGGEATIDNLSAIITTIATPFQGRTAPWIIMNAPRPIRGHEIKDGEFIHGRFFAAIDTSKDDATAMLEENRKLDAKVVESVDRDTAIKIGLSQMPENYREATEKMLTDADKADAAVSMLLDKIPSTITHGKASELIQEARSMPSPQAPPKVTPQPQAEPGFVLTLRDILAGKYDSDTARIGSLLDAAAEEAEKAGLMSEHEVLFNQAADHLTAMLKKRAA